MKQRWIELGFPSIESSTALYESRIDEVVVGENDRRLATWVLEVCIHRQASQEAGDELLA